MSDPARQALRLVAPVVAGVLLVLAALRAYLPADSRALQVLGCLRCPFLAATGVRCPLCGLTTSMALTLRGRLEEALAAHPLGPAVVVLAVGALVYSLVRGKRPAGKRAPERE
jgi:hypothetical protein